MEERLRKMEQEVVRIGTKLDVHIMDFKQHEVHDNDRYLEMRQVLDKLTATQTEIRVTLASLMTKVGMLLGALVIIAGVFGADISDYVKGFFGG